MCALRPMEERSEAAWMAALATERARAAPHAEIAGSGECGSHRCARTVDLQLMHLPQRARRLSFSLSASFFWDAPPVDFGAGVSIASSTQRLRHVLRSRSLREVGSLGSLVNMHLDRISQIWPSGLILTTSSNQMTSRAGIPPGVFERYSDRAPLRVHAARRPKLFWENEASQEGRREGKSKVGWGGGRLVGGPSSVITHSLPHSALLLFCWRGSSSTNQAIHAEPQRVWSSDWRLPRRPTSR